MNRSIFIVIVDFLLLSLIAFARFDQEEKPSPQEVQASLTDASSAQDVAETLKMSLEEERRSREQLNTRLTQTQQTLRSHEEALADRDKQVEQTTASLQQTQANLQRQEQEARRLDEERLALTLKLSSSQTNVATLQQQFSSAKRETATLQQQAEAAKNTLANVQQRFEATKSELANAQQQAEATKSNLATVQQQFEATKSNLSNVQQQAETSKSSLGNIQQQFTVAASEARLAKEKLDMREAELRRREQEAAALQTKLQETERRSQELERSRLAAETEKGRIATQLQVAETEKRFTREQLEAAKGEVQLARTEVQTVRAEKTQLQQQTVKLAENVATLAEQSEKLSQEVRENRSLTPNTIFAEFVTNQVTCSFHASRAGALFGAVNRDEVAKTVLVSHGGQIFVICHVEDTPLSFTAIGTPWEALLGTIRHRSAIHSLAQLAFMDGDPRILIAPVNAAVAKQLGTKVYPIAKDPYKFQEAILIGAKDGYYGECEFKIDPQTPRYVRMHRDLFRRFVGKFVPSRGDLVFSKTGEVVGIMANKGYCLVLTDFSAARHFALGPNVATQQPSALLSQMYNQVMTMPFRLQ